MNKSYNAEAIEVLTGLDYDKSGKYLVESGGSVKIAIVMAIKSCSKADAKQLLLGNDGVLRNVIGDAS